MLSPLLFLVFINDLPESISNSTTVDVFADDTTLSSSSLWSDKRKEEDVKELQKELKNDYIINQELSSFAGGLALRCGRWLALANAALITTKHSKFTTKGKEEEDVVIEAAPTSRPSTRDSDGYPLEGFDEVDGPGRNLEVTCEEP